MTKRDTWLRLLDEAHIDLTAARDELNKALPLVKAEYRDDTEKALNYTNAALEALSD